MQHHNIFKSPALTLAAQHPQKRDANDNVTAAAAATSLLLSREKFAAQPTPSRIKLSNHPTWQKKLKKKMKYQEAQGARKVPDLQIP